MQVVGRATLVRRGARIGNAQGELWQNGKLDATATATSSSIAASMPGQQHHSR